MFQNVTECSQVVIWERFGELIGSSLRLAGVVRSSIVEQRHKLVS